MVQESFLKNYLFLFIYGCAGSFCCGVFSSGSEWGLLYSCGFSLRGLLLLRSTDSKAHGLQLWVPVSRAQAQYL